MVKMDEYYKVLKEKFLNFDDTEWKNYLNFASKKEFSKSLSNMLMIYAQKPDARLVTGATEWNKLNREVPKDKFRYKKIWYFAPVTYKKESKEDEDSDKSENVIYGVKWVYGFDISDTQQLEGKEVKIDLNFLDKEVINEFFEAEEYIKYFANKVDTNVFFMDTGSKSKGYFEIKSKKIVVSDSLSDTQKLKTLIHEITHYLDFKLNPKDEDTRAYREFIAESMAFMVCNHIGLDTSDYSILYLKSWIEDDFDIFMKAFKRLEIIFNIFISWIKEKNAKENISARRWENEPKKP